MKKIKSHLVQDMPCIPKKIENLLLAVTQMACTVQEKYNLMEEFRARTLFHSH